MKLLLFLNFRFAYLSVSIWCLKVSTIIVDIIVKKKCLKTKQKNFINLLKLCLTRKKETEKRNNADVKEQLSIVDNNFFFFKF